jgi:DHA3 family macrolide efflux protein-like MFS transporter
MIVYNVNKWKRLFPVIWGGQALSLVGSRLVGFSVMWWLTVQTGKASTLAVANLMGALPTIVLAPFAGVWVDRWDRRRVMIAADAAVALATGLLALLFGLGVQQPWHVYLLLFARSLGNVIHGAAMSASTSLMVPKDQLGRVGGLNQTRMGLANIGAPPLAALLVALMPIQYILAIDLGTALIAILPLLVIRIPQPESVAGQDMPSSPLLLLLFVYAAAVRVIAKPAWQFLPLLVTQQFEGQAIHLGFMSSAFGFGIIAGGTLLSLWGGFKRNAVTSWVGLLGCGLAFLILGLAPANAFWLAVAASAFFGLSFSIYTGPIRAILQASVPPGIQGRIFSIYSSALSVTTPIGLGLVGLLGDVLDIAVVFALGGAVILAFALMVRATPSVMHVERRAQVGAGTETGSVSRPVG